ncbi:MAG TPA: hypothetical protein PLU35_13580 [Phycisphaerales bacterium]|nr:hypothetical protein [Phycisphaerales bacterium]
MNACRASIAVTVARAILVLLIATWLIVAGIGKLADLDGFAEALLAHGLIAGPLIQVVSFVLPFVEVLIGAGVVWGLASGSPVRRLVPPLVAVFLAFVLYAAWLSINPPPPGSGEDRARRAGAGWHSLALRALLRVRGLTLACASCSVAGRGGGGDGITRWPR